MARLDRQASRDKYEKPDKTEPALTAEPTENTEATDPAEPIDRIDPAEPMDRIEPLEPMDRIEPLDPMLSSEPADPPELADFPMAAFSHWPASSAAPGRILAGTRPGVLARTRPGPARPRDATARPA
jgi:hypothetical protein